MNLSFRTAAAVMAVASLAGACSSSDVDLDDAAPSTTTTSAPIAPLPTEPEPTTPDTGYVPDLDWTSCGRAQCAEVVVPLDHDEPAGETIELFVKRLPALGDRIGALFFNFGGPGGGAADLVEAFGVPAAIRARFDIVGMDPRGVGRSTPLGCGIDPRTLYGVDPTIEDDIDADTLISISERYAADCEEQAGELLPHVGTRDVARDMDLLRAAMGDETISYVGYSYGTSIGQAYAEEFPDRVRGMILDGVVDTAPSGIDVAVEQALGFEAALARWAIACNSRETCTLTDPIGAVDLVLARAEEGIASSDDRRALGPGEAAVGLAYPLYDQRLWPALDQAVASAVDGDGGPMVDLADRYANLVDFSIYFAVSCLDSSWPRDTDTFLARAEAAGDVAPRFGEAIVNDYIRCAVWPTSPEPLGAISAPGTEPILVVSTTGDPATPYENGVRVAERLEAGVLLTYDGDGHTIVFQGSGCVDDIAIDYLIDGTVPADGTVC